MEDSTTSIDDFERIDREGGGARGRTGVGSTTGTDEMSVKSSSRSSLSRSTSASGSASGDGGSFVGEVDTGPSENDLLRIMECPVCAEFPIPPIFNCSNGHFTCNECISLLTTCSLCEAKFTQVRNYALESIIESTKFKCRYNQNGCRERINGAEYRSHLDGCPYGPAVCNEKKFTQCEDKVIERVNYVDHLYLCHNAKGVNIKDPVVGNRLRAVFPQSKGDEFSPLYLTSPSTGQTFFVFTKKYKSFYCWWVASFKPEDSETAFAKLTWSRGPVLYMGGHVLTETDENLRDGFENDRPENNSAREASTDDPVHPYGLQWTLPIHSLKKPFNEIRDSGLCAVLPDTHMQPFGFIKSKIVSVDNADEEETPEVEVEWNLTVEIVSSNKLDKETPNKSEKPLQFDIDWQTWLEKLRNIFPLLALMFMIVGVGLLAAIYIQTSSSTSPSQENRNENNPYDNQGAYGKQKLADMKPYPHLNDRLEDTDYEGYRGFYYNRDKIRNGYDDYSKDNKGNYGSGGWKSHQKYHKGRKVVYGSGAPEHDDEFVGYRGFYHQKGTEESNNPQQQQQQTNNQQHEQPSFDSHPKNVASKLITKFLSFTADQLSKFFGIKPAKDKVKKTNAAGEAPPQSEKNSVFGFKIEGLDFVGVIVAKMFFLTFCLFCIITALISLTVYKRWIYSVPGGARRTRRTTRSSGSDSNRDEPSDSEQIRRPASFDDFVRRRAN